MLHATFPGVANAHAMQLAAARRITLLSRMAQLDIPNCTSVSVFQSCCLAALDLCELRELVVSFSGWRHLRSVPVLAH